MPRSARLAALAALLLTFVAVSPWCLAAAPARSAPLIPPPPPPAVPTGPEIVAVDDAVDDAVAADFVVFADGSYAVVWQEADAPTLRARRFGTNDQPVGAPFEVGPVTEPPQLDWQRGWDVVGLYEDVWAVAWAQPTCDACPSSILLSLYDGAAPIFEGELVAGGETGFFGPVLAAGTAGRFAVGWTVDNAVPEPAMDGLNFSDVFARIYDFGGAPESDVFEVNEDEYEEQTMRDAVFVPSAEPGAEDVVFLWESYEGEGVFYDVFQRHFDADGNPRGGEARVNENKETSQFAPAIARTGFGYLVVWTDWSYTPGFDGAIIGRSFAADGTPLGAEFRISDPQPAANRDRASVAGTPDGAFVVLWGATCAVDECSADKPDGPDGSRGGIFGRSYGPDWQFGNDSGVIGVPVETLGNQGGAAVRAASSTGYLALWLSRPQETDPTRVVLRRLEPPALAQCTGLCLGDDRFQVTVEWKDFQGGSGVGTPVARDDDWGTFWFFRPSNVELAVKVLDGTAINGHFWVFYASLSNVEYTLRVTDRVTGLAATYTNPAGHFGSRGDTTALPSVPLPLPSPPFPVPRSSLASAARRAPLPTAARLAPGQPVSRAGVAAERPATLTLSPCAADELCLQGDRFAVEIEWQDFLGHSGDGVGTQLTSDSGWFWFFRQGNPEVLVKVLDGRPVNGHFWVFYAALSNVGFTLRVTDRMTDETVTYESPLGSFASRGDTTAFAGQ